MARRAYLAPLTFGAVLAVACTELRVASDAGFDPEGETGQEEENDDDGGSSRRDALARPDVKTSDGGKDAAPPVVCDGPCPPEILIDGLVQATAITVDTKNVYFAIESGNGKVFQCPKTGCKGAPIELGPGYATSIVVAGNTVYWGDFAAGKLQSCAVGGCNKQPTAVVSNQPQIKGAVSDDVDLFWATNGAIKHCTRSTCSTASSETITTNQGFVRSLAADQGKIVWPNSADKMVYACAAGPCPSPTVLGSGSHDVSVHSGRAYWVNTTKQIVWCSINGCANKPFIVGSSFSPMKPVSDGVHVYWRDDLYREIYRCSTSGCTPGPEILAEDQGGQPGGEIALDGEYVYWTTTSTVARLRK